MARGRTINSICCSLKDVSCYYLMAPHDKTSAFQTHFDQILKSAKLIETTMTDLAFTTTRKNPPKLSSSSTFSRRSDFSHVNELPVLHNRSIGLGLVVSIAEHRLGGSTAMLPRTARIICWAASANEDIVAQIARRAVVGDEYYAPSTASRPACSLTEQSALA